MTAYKKISLNRIYPTLWGVMMYNVLRAITDLSHNGPFWDGNLLLHIVGLFFSILFCYGYNHLWERRLCTADGSHSFARDYLYTSLELFVSLNILLLIGQLTGVLFMGAGWIDYMLINATYLPLLLIFYTLIRNNIISRNIHTNLLTLEKLKLEKKEAELNFLKAQYHPHFLFNALNTIYFQVDESNEEARETIEQLSGLLRYQLYDVNHRTVFKQEIDYIRAYISFEQIRKTNKLSVNLDIDPSLQEQQVHPLLFQPLIENAFKYVSGAYSIDVSLKLIDNQVNCIIHNSISERIATVNKKGNGIGLENLRRRLELLYPGKHSLHTRKDNSFFTASLTFKL